MELHEAPIRVHAYRLVYAESAPGPEMLWEWDKIAVGRLLWNATTFGRELTHQSFPTWDALGQENQRIWATSYLPHPRYQPWQTWRAWLEEYRALVRDVQALAEAHQSWSGKARR